jgi:hypothetical protein
MVTIRSVNEIISNLIDFFKLAQPNLDTKPGTVARDLFIEGPSSQLSLLYDEIQKSSNKQSFILSIGTDLDKLGKNFGLVRRQSTPSSGVALLTFSSLKCSSTILRSNNHLVSIVDSIIIVLPFTNLIISGYDTQYGLGNNHDEPIFV